MSNDEFYLVSTFYDAERSRFAVNLTATVGTVSILIFKDIE